MFINFQGSSSTIKNYNVSNTAFSPIINTKDLIRFQQNFQFREEDSEIISAKKNSSFSNTEMKPSQSGPMITIFNPELTVVRSEGSVKSQENKDGNNGTNRYLAVYPFNPTHSFVTNPKNQMCLEPIGTSNINMFKSMSNVNVMNPIFLARNIGQKGYTEDFETPISTKLNFVLKNDDLKCTEDFKEEHSYTTSKESNKNLIESSLISIKPSKTKALIISKPNPIKKKKKKISQYLKMKDYRSSHNIASSQSSTIKKRRKTRKSNPESFSTKCADLRRSGRKKRFSSTSAVVESPSSDSSFAQKIYSKRGRKSKIPKNYICKICRKKFVTPSALGGHTSKAHPGESNDYQDKLKIRNENKNNRIALIHARKSFFMSLGYDYDKMNKDQIKLLIKKNKAEYYNNLLNYKKLYNNTDGVNENDFELYDGKITEIN